MSTLPFKTITAEEFCSRINNHVNAVLKITTSWSGASLIVSPIIDEMAEHFGSKIEFFEMDYERDEHIRKYYEVTTFPTLLFFKHGVLVDQLTGVFHKNVLYQRLQSIIDN